MIKIEINSIDVTDKILQGSLNVSQRITNQADSADFRIVHAGDRNLIPEYPDEVAIYDGDTKIFGGTIMTVEQVPLTSAGGIIYDVGCVDYRYDLDRRLVSRVYTNQTIHDIIADMVDTYAPSFTYNGVSSTFLIQKIVFNQIPISTCLKRLADLLNHDWYVDESKDIKFFQKYALSAPYDLTDDNGNYIYKTLKRNTDSSQIANRVKIRGGEYDGATYEDVITVTGNDTKSFQLPYGFADLTIELDTGAGYVAQTVGIDFIDSFDTKDVLYNFQEKMIHWENNLADTNKIKFSGKPKVPVFAVAEDPVSIAEYGVIEKLIRDTSIESNTVARRRASAELYSYAEPVIDAKFETRTPGLRAGMTVRIQSDNQNTDDQLIIKSITLRAQDHNSFKYSVQLVSTKRYDFITLLQSILEPDPRPSDEQEVAEEIFTDTQTITITDETELVTPVMDDQTIEISENYMIDDTDVTYVLAPYAPISQTDTKRQGRLDISMVVY